MKLRLLVVIVAFLGALSSNAVFAQSDSTQEFDVVTFLGRNFNPGISVGIGGGHPDLFYPNFTLKCWRLDVSGSMRNPLLRNDIYSLQVELETIKLPPVFKFNNSFISVSGGVNRRDKITKNGNNKTELQYGTLGINSYLNKHSKVSVKLGSAFVTNRDFDLSWRTTENDIVPYGELSYTWYLIPIREKQYLKRKIGQDGFEENEEYLSQSEYPGLSRWFNPFWSAGLGTGRGWFFLPSAGVKIDRVALSVGMFGVDGLSSIGGHLSFDAFEMKPFNGYSRRFALGASSVYLGEIDSKDCSLINGFTFGVNHYKKGGRLNLNYNLGLGHYQKIETRYLPYPENDVSSGLMIIGGVSLGIYAFRFGNN